MIKLLVTNVKLKAKLDSAYQWPTFDKMQIKPVTFYNQPDASKGEFGVLSIIILLLQFNVSTSFKTNFVCWVIHKVGST